MSRLPVAALPAKSALGRRERDFLLLNIYVLARHGYVDRAAVLAEALHLVGDSTPDVLLARAVLRFSVREWAAALACIEELDRVDPAERFGSYRLNERQRMRRYLKMRCLHELKETGRARDAMEVYMRHGAENAAADE
jgi:hypothetical protein